MSNLSPGQKQQDTQPNQLETTEETEEVTLENINRESRNQALLVWVGTIFLFSLPSLVMFLMKKGDDYVADQVREALNWSITAIIGWATGWLLTLVLIGPLVVWVVTVCNFVFSVMGAWACSKGDKFRVPMALRLIK